MVNLLNNKFDPIQSKRSARPAFLNHRRRFGVPLLLVIVLHSFANFAACSQQDGKKTSSQQQDVKQEANDFTPFIAYGGSADAEEVVAVRYKQTGGKLVAEIVQREKLGFEAAPIIYHARHRLLYVASLRPKKDEGNKLVVFSVARDGQLARLEEYPLQYGSAYLSFDRRGRFLLSASYFDGDVDVYQLGEKGVPNGVVYTHHEDRDKAHAILTSPDNRYAYVPYVKNQNALYQYTFDEETGKLVSLDPPQAKAPMGTGPRHIAYHPTKPFVFFSNEQQLGVSAYRITAGGTLDLVQVCPPGKLRPVEKVAASDIVITPDGKYLYVGVRDFGESALDAVHCYEVAGNGGITHLRSTKSDAIPWGLRLSPQGGHLLVTASQGATLTAYKIGPRGRLDKRSTIDWGKTVRGIAVVELD